MNLARKDVLASAALAGQKNRRVASRGALRSLEQRDHTWVLRSDERLFDGFLRGLVIGLGHESNRRDSIGLSNIHRGVIPRNARVLPISAWLYVATLAAHRSAWSIRG